MTTAKGFEARRQRALAAGAQKAKAQGQGLGFVKFQDQGDYIEGDVVECWEVQDRQVVTIKATKVAAPVFDGDKNEVQVEPGDLVYVGISSADLRGKITNEHRGARVLIGFVGEKALKGGRTMKRFDVSYWSTGPEPNYEDEEREAMQDEAAA
jgi:hypothetical protein